MSRSLVVSEQENIPSGPFFVLAEQLRAMKMKTLDAKIEFWIREIHKAHAFYKKAQNPSKTPALAPQAPPIKAPQSIAPIASRLKTSQDTVARRFAALRWQFVPQNPGVLLQMESRIDQTIANQGLLTYSQLVDGLDFYLPQSKLNAPYRIEHKNWNGSDGAMVGEFLCHISMQSFIQRGVLASAVVVKSSGKISSGFFELAGLLDLLERGDQATDAGFWQLEKGYVYNPQTAQSRAISYK